MQAASFPGGTICYPSFKGTLKELFMHRVVVIDDHPAVVLALTTILERDADLKVIGSAGDGGEGMRVYREMQPDVLIIDLDIPGLNGLDLIRRVRFTDSAVKILVNSSFSPNLWALHCQAAGANGYISKTESVTHILSAVKAVLAGFDCFPAHGLFAPPTGEVVGTPTASLTERERTVLRYLAKGHSNKEIAETLSVSNKTISTHKTNILSKLGLRNLVDLAAFAKAHRLI
jgi:DNA-binding NarL/FixJ family response regulator